MYVIKNQLAFIAHPRVASRATKRAFLAAGAVRHASHHKIDERQVREVLGRHGIVCCSVRNMFDVVVSWYHNCNPDELKSRIEFPAFVKQIINEPERHRYFSTSQYFYGLPYCNRVFRYETLQQDVNQALQDIGKPPFQLEVVGQSNRKPYQEYYNNTTRRMIENRWGRDLEQTGYEF